MLSNDWDKSLKFLTKTNPQAFVSFLLEGARFLKECDKELQTRTILADLVYEVQWHGETIILHAEFQRSRDEDMARRVWEYNVSVECVTQLPVYSVVLYLVKDGNAIEPPYERRLCTGELIHHFQFRNFKLWEISSSVLRQPAMEGMLPLMPLTKDGARREVVEEVISDLLRVDRQDLLPITYCIAALVFPESSENKEWLEERFRPMLHLFQNSWAYQEMVAEGKKEGLREGLQKGQQEGLREGLQKGQQEGLQKGQQEGLQKGQQEGLQEGLLVLQEASIHYVQKRFPDLANNAKQHISAVNDINRLHTAFDAILDAATTAEVEQIIVHLSDEIPPK